MKRIFLAIILVVGCEHLWASAGNAGDEVVVVYNSRLPESKSLAQYYAQRRNVPAGQVFGFDLTTNEDMSRAEFRDGLQKPLFKALSDKKLWETGARLVHATTNTAGRVEWVVVSSKIRYAVLCCGVPLRIEQDPNLVEPGSENLRPEFRRNEAAVDSELALLPVLNERPPLNGPLRCQVYGSTNRALLNPTNGLLMVTRIDGPSFAIARGLVDKALEAETNGLWGRAYFDLRSITDPGYKMGDDWIRAASETLPPAGIRNHCGYQSRSFPRGLSHEPDRDLHRLV